MTYGSNCVNPCGQCSRGVPCDPVTGACPGSCQPGWTGDKCDTGMYACGTSMSERLGPVNQGLSHTHTHTWGQVRYRYVYVGYKYV